MDDTKTQTPEKIQGGMPAKTLILIIVLAAAAILLLSFAFNQKNIQLPNQTTKVKESPAHTTLSLSSNPKLLSSSYTDEVTIDTGANVVTGVQLELSYDPKVLTAVDVTPGTFFENSNVLIKKVDTVNGRITYALGVALGEKGKSGKGVIASLHFALIPGQTQPVTTTITFLPKTQVSAQETIESVLNKTEDANLTLEQASAQPSTSAK